VKKKGGAERGKEYKKKICFQRLHPRVRFFQQGKKKVTTSGKARGRASQTRALENKGNGGGSRGGGMKKGKEKVGNLRSPNGSESISVRRFQTAFW